MAVVAVLSERDKRSLAAAEALLLEQDEALVRSFDQLACNDHVDVDPPPAPRAPEPAPDRPRAGPVPRSAPMYHRLLRVLFALGLVGLLALAGWIFYAGDAQIRLLTGLVMFPVLALVAFTVFVLSRRDGRD